MPYITAIEIPADSIDETLTEIDAKKAEIDEIRESLQKAKAGLVCRYAENMLVKKRHIVRLAVQKLSVSASPVAMKKTVFLSPRLTGAVTAMRLRNRKIVRRSGRRSAVW